VTKIITAILGFLLLVLGVSSLLILRQDKAAAEAVDASFLTGESAQPSNCRDVIQSVTLPKRVMTEKESQTLRIVVANVNGVGICNTAVRLAALNFELAPPSTERVVSLEPGGDPVSLLWILKPVETGAFEIVLTAGDETEVLGLVVTNVVGLTALQVQILSYISSLLGPMLTFPWWYEQWEKRKKAREKGARKRAVKESAVSQQTEPEETAAPSPPK
jgi:hypothetical protein